MSVDLSFVLRGRGGLLKERTTLHVYPMYSLEIGINPNASDQHQRHEFMA